ncbi:MAG: hypothetical protein AAF423_14070, partial [Pseudomonadota bacterium]
LQNDLTYLRDKFKGSLRGTLEFEVSRDNVFEEMIATFKKRTSNNKNLEITFKGEDATGEGVTRDALSLFFEKVYQLFDGENEKVPGFDVDLEEEILTIIGTVITQAFVQFGTFPYKLCRAALKYHLYDSNDDQILMASYLNYIANREAAMIQSFRNNANSHDDIQPILDVLSEGKVYAKPTSENISELCLKIRPHPTLFSERDVAAPWVSWWLRKR